VVDSGAEVHTLFVFIIIVRLCSFISDSRCCSTPHRLPLFFFSFLTFPSPQHGRAKVTDARCSAPGFLSRLPFLRINRSLVFACPRGSFKGRHVLPGHVSLTATPPLSHAFWSIFCTHLSPERESQSFARTVKGFRPAPRFKSFPAHGVIPPT